MEFDLRMLAKSTELKFRGFIALESVTVYLVPDSKAEKSELSINTPSSRPY